MTSATDHGRDLYDAAHSTVVDRVIEFIEERYAEQISLRDVAEAVGYSRCHLTTKFRRATGLSVTAWIIRRRIEEARRLLASGNLSVAEASELVGFGDPCYFNRQFVRHFGVTPGRFRTTMRPE